MGNHGAIAAGDVQWMTAGSGITSSGNAKGKQAGQMHGFQLWRTFGRPEDDCRLSRSEGARHPEVKTTTAPMCESCAEVSGQEGAGGWIAADPVYLDVSVAPGKRKTASTERGVQHLMASVATASGPEVADIPDPGESVGKRVATWSQREEFSAPRRNRTSR